MKSRLIHPAAVVLAAGLLLVSCSGDSDPDSADENIEGVQSEDSQEPEPSDDASETEAADDGVERPVIELPDDMVNVFEDTETGDPVQDAILADVQRQIIGVDMALAESNPDHPVLAFYHAEEGLTNAERYVESAADSGYAWAGTSVYYAFDVDNEGRRSREPIVTYCSDQTESRTKDLATGELLPGEENLGTVGQLQIVVEENDLGVWQTTQVLPGDETGDRECHR